MTNCIQDSRQIYIWSMIHWIELPSRKYATQGVIYILGRPITLCLKKRPTFTTCHNFYIHSSIATIFGINVAEKVGNQNILYFPTTHDDKQCFCTTWRNRKSGNCVFSLKCCMLFHQNTRNTVKNITWSELNHTSLSKPSSGSTRQDLGREHSIMLTVTHMLCVSQVWQAVSRCVKDRSCSLSSLE